MVFNSAVFVFYFIVVLLVYLALGRFRKGTLYQNRFLLVASYFFYGYWDWVFLGLILISTLTDYTVALVLDRMQDGRKRKWVLIISMSMNLGLLGAFKYYDFFIGSFIASAQALVPGAFAHGTGNLLLHVILPVGISFYTFQTMSYTIDVYRRVIPAERNIFDFALFVCYFPQLVAGPIERAQDLLTRLKNPRTFSWENLQKGAWLILLGFFMKVYVADNLGPLVDRVFLPNAAAYHANPALALGQGGAQVLLASMAFILQVYGDFGGYSFIAMGTSLMMGIDLSLNFNAPELSKNPADLWRRWHMTLGRWVMDYIYIPLGGNRHGDWMRYRNLLIAFTLMGLWHGANWTFVIWGFYSGVLIVIHHFMKSRGLLPSLPEGSPFIARAFASAGGKLGIFLLFSLSGIFFRAYDFRHAMALFHSLLSFPWDLTGYSNGVEPALAYAGDILKVVWILIAMDIAAEKYGRLFWIFDRPVWVRVVVYSTLYFFIIIQGVFGKDVIYFAF